MGEGGGVEGGPWLTCPVRSVGSEACSLDIWGQVPNYFLKLYPEVLGLGRQRREVQSKQERGGLLDVGQIQRLHCHLGSGQEVLTCVSYAQAY